VKKKPNGSKELHFTTLKCGVCAGFVMVLWAGAHGNHDFRVLPWPRKVANAPDHWPSDIGRYWVQAHRSLSDENWDAAAVMARSALQLSLRQLEAGGRTLKDEIEDLASKGLLPPIMNEWAHEVRELGNDSAHPKPGQPATSPEDARDMVQFLDYFLEYLYTLPHRIERYRERRRDDSAT